MLTLLVSAAASLACGGSSAVTAFAMTYDADRRQVVMFGGVMPDGRASGTLRGWNGATWTCIADDGPARFDATIAYDAARHVLVVFGGRAAGATLTDTWEYGAGGWRQAQMIGPPASVHSAAAYDAGAGGILLHFVTDDDRAQPTTARWTGATWSIVGRGPAAELPDALLSSDDTHRALLLTVKPTDVNDHFIAALFTWGDSSWRALATSGAAPQFSPHAPAARTRDGVLVYAGFEPDQRVHVWHLDETTWHTFDGAMPPRRRGTAMAYDASRGVVVLHGGFDGTTTLDDTWEWDHVAWHRIR